MWIWGERVPLPHCIRCVGADKMHCSFHCDAIDWNFGENVGGNVDGKEHPSDSERHSEHKEVIPSRNGVY